MGPKGSELLSDPVDFSIGDFKHSAVDMVIPGRGFNFEFKRTYRGTDSLWFEYGFPRLGKSVGSLSPSYLDQSTLGPSETIPPELSSIGPMGVQWTHSYFMLLFSYEVPTDSAAYPTLIKGGRFDSFIDRISDTGASEPVWSREDTDSVAKYVPEDQANGVSEHYVVQTAQGGKYFFEPFSFPEYDLLGNTHWFRLASIEDWHGNTLSVAYKDVGTEPESMRVDHIIDTLGNQITFEYGHATSGYLLTAIVDETSGRRVDYSYDHQGLCLPCEDDVIITGGGGPLIVEPESETGIPIDEACPIPAGTDPTVPLSFVLTSVQLPEIGPDAGSSVFDEIPSEHDRYTRRSWDYTYEQWSLASASDAYTNCDCDAVRIKTITDPAGTVILTNHYEAMDSNDANPLEGRVAIAGQDTPSGSYQFQYTYGDDGLPADYTVTVSTKRRQIVELTYERQDDLRGAVCCTAYCWDQETVGNDNARLANFLVSRRHFTGLATDAAPFDRTIGKLRSTDEDSYLTTYTRNSSWKLTSSVAPNDDTTTWEYGYRDDLPGCGTTDDVERGLKKLAVTKRTRDVGGTPIEENWRYTFTFGGCCGASYPTEYTDGEGNKTVFTYDPLTGDVTRIERGIVGANGPLSVEDFEYNNWGQLEKHTHPGRLIDGSGQNEVRRIDVYEYEDDTNSIEYGRLKRIGVDVGADGEIDGAGGEELVTEYFYDAVGNIIRVVQPSGDYKSLLWNQAGQIIREQWWEVTGGGGGAPAETLLSWREYFYDSRGNPVRTDTVAFDLPNAAATRSSELWAITLSEYDAENNVIRTATREMPALNQEGTTLPTPDSNGAYSLAQDSQANGWDPNEWVVTEYEYDKNKNLVAVRLPEAVSGTQVDNGHVMVYDERDLLYRRFRGITNTDVDQFPVVTVDDANDPLPLVYQADYDEKGRPTRSVMLDPLTGVESRENLTDYDPFDRVIKQTDPMGNYSVYTYDNNHNVITTEVYGELADVPGNTGNGILAHSKTDYDALNRPTDQFVNIFDLVTLNGLFSEWQWSHTEYNSDSSIRSFTIPAGANPRASYLPGAAGMSTTEYLYDTASRVTTITDQLGNQTVYDYDIDSNLTSVKSIEVSDLSSPSQTFETRYQYDGLDRRTSVIEGVYGQGTLSGPQNTTTMQYDSRSNLIATTDPRGSVTEFLYDGLSRRFQTTVDPSGLNIKTSVLYDRSSRVIELTDANDHSTEYFFDSLGREIKRVYADDTEHTTLYDEYGNTATLTDARGVVITQSFDENNRMTSRTIDRTQAGSVGGTASETYEYDGLNRVVTADNDFAHIDRAYDSRGLMVAETFNADMDATPDPFPDDSDRTVTSTYDIAGNMTLCTYASGREVYRTHDNLNRVAGIWDDDTQTTAVAEYKYFGPGRVEQRTTGNGAGLVQTDYTYTGFENAPAIPGDSGFRHIVSIEHDLQSSGVLLEGRSFTWDPAGNKTSHHDLRDTYNGYRERDFGYDTANRLVDTATAFPSSPTQDGTIKYHLDGVHNRTQVEQVTGSNDAGAAVGDYVALSEPDDEIYHADLNQYTVVPRLDGGALDFEHAYDANGSLQVIAEYPRPADIVGDYVLDAGDLAAFTTAFNDETSDGDFNGDGIYDQADLTGFVTAFTNGPSTYYNARFTYDERNQLVEFEANDGPTPIKKSRYRYDCFNRRVASLIDTDGNGTDDEVTYFIYAGQAAWQLCEEFDGPASADSHRKSYVYGNYIDEVLQMRDHASDDDYFYHQDDLFSVYTMTDEAGDVVERYEYGDYGQVSVMAEDGASRSMSSYGNRHTYTGRLLDEELTLDDEGKIVQYRNRYLSVSAGQFYQRDPLGYADGMNVYNYTRASPLTLVDPYGNIPPDSCDPERDRRRLPPPISNPNILDPTLHGVCGVVVFAKIKCGSASASFGPIFTDNGNEIVDIINALPPGCCIKSFSINAHCDGSDIWGKKKGQGPTVNQLSSAMKGKMCSGASVDLNMCFSTGIGDTLCIQNPDIRRVECHKFLNYETCFGIGIPVFPTVLIPNKEGQP